MIKTVRYHLLISFLGLLIFQVKPAYARQTVLEADLWNIGLYTGYSISNPDSSINAGNLDSTLINFHIGRVLFTGKPQLFPRGALEIAAEPFLSLVANRSNGEQTEASLESGMLSTLNYHFDLDYHLLPYIEGGLGLLYHDFQGYRLGGGFSFTQMFGAGLSYFLSDSLSVSMGYRFRHSSNASLYAENDGLNTHALIIGFRVISPRK